MITVRRFNSLLVSNTNAAGFTASGLLRLDTLDCELLPFRRLYCGALWLNCRPYNYSANVAQDFGRQPMCYNPFLAIFRDDSLVVNNPNAGDYAIVPAQPFLTDTAQQLGGNLPGTLPVPVPEEERATSYFDDDVAYQEAALLRMFPMKFVSQAIGLEMAFTSAVAARAAGSILSGVHFFLGIKASDHPF